MSDTQPRLREQLRQLLQLRKQCLDCRAAFEDLQAQQRSVELASQQACRDAEHSYESQLRMQRERENAAHRQRLADLAEVYEADQAAIERDLEAGLLALRQQHEADVAVIEKKLESELWVLQSICDEAGDDSPIGIAERSQETLLTQQKMLAERFSTLEEQARRTADFMRHCHAAPDDELPPPDIEQPQREEARTLAIEQIDRAVNQIASIGRLKLPHWIYGLRPAVMWLVLFFVITLIAVGTRADVRDFINADVARPDWRWFGVSTVIGLVASAMLTMILLMIAQQKLRNRFADVMQFTANARAAEHFWRQRSESELRRQQKAADEWQTQMLQARDQRAKRMQDATGERIRQTRQTYAADVAELQSRSRGAMSQCRQTYEQALQVAEDENRQRLQELDQRLRQVRQDAIEVAERETSEQQANISSRRADVLQQWREAQQRLMRLSQASRDLSAGLTRWPQGTSAAWSPPTESPPVVAIGDLLSTVPTLSRPDDDEVVNTCIDLPAVLQFPNDTAVLIEHDAAGRESSLRFVQALLLRLLTTVPPGRVQFTLIDPVGLGQSFSAMMHLADFDELLINNRIWTDTTQIREQLKKVAEQMENVFQTYLRSEFQTIEEYNAAAGEVAEPYHFVVVAGFPAGFTEESAGYLTSILSSGPRCGVYPILMQLVGQPLPRSFDADDLVHHTQQFRAVDGRVFPVHDQQAITPVTGVEFEVVTAPDSADYVRIVRQVGEASRDARRVEVAFSRIAPRADAVWSHSTAAGIDLPIGRAGAARLQYLRLGRGTSQHVLIAGKTGSGKSTLLHIVITNLAMHYSPNEIQFFLIDFKKGVEFRTYAANNLPHARVIAIESDREFGLSVLERLDEVLQERGEEFRTRGVQDVPAFRREFPDEPMPRLLLLIDEFQEFFVAEDRVSSRAALLLDRLIRQGRAFGIHVVLGSQTLGGAYSLARSTLGQVAVRIALQCSESDAHLILSEDNSAARLLSRPGEAIYNDANGLLEGNHPFQIAWLEEQQREEMIESLRARRIEPAVADSRMIVFEGNVPPSIELCPELHAWLTSVPDAENLANEPATIWLGEPVAIAKTTRVELRRAGGQNLLIVGQESDMADSLLLMSVISLLRGAASPSDQDQLPPIQLLHDGRDRESLARLQQSIPSGAASPCRLLAGTDVDAVIAGLHERLLDREAQPEAANATPEVLIIRNIGQFRSLRKDEDDFGFGNYGEAKTENAASQLTDLIKRGPLVGLHVIIWSDSYSNAVRWLSTSLMREFENRIAFRMNATDSASLIDSPAAAAMTPGRAILYRDQTGATEKFRPFAWPSSVWLDELLSAVSTADAANEPDIDSLTIE
jgi:S-DNA-T family DNA segregation ATPase FtsK/SpoIIIE